MAAGGKKLVFPTRHNENVAIKSGSRPLLPLRSAKTEDSHCCKTVIAKLEDSDFKWSSMYI